MFNAAQVDCWAPPTPPTRTVIDRHADAETFIDNTGAEITYGQNHAAYQPARSRIERPNADQFTDADAYNSTACHQTHPLARPPQPTQQRPHRRIRDDAYATEKFGAAIAFASLGITDSPRDDHVALQAHRLPQSAASFSVWTAAPGPRHPKPTF